MPEKSQNQPNFERAKADFEKYSKEIEQIAQNIILKIPEWKKAVAENPNSLVTFDIDGTVFYDFPGNFRSEDSYLPIIPPMKKVILELQKNNIPLIFVTDRSKISENYTTLNFETANLNISPNQIVFCGYNDDEVDKDNEGKLALENDECPNTRKGSYFNRIEKNYKIIAAIGNARSDILWRRSQINPDNIEKGSNTDVEKFLLPIFAPYKFKYLIENNFNFE